MQARKINPFGLRLQPEIKKKAEIEAKKSRRSLNAEISLLIEEGLEWRAQKAVQIIT